MGKVCMRELLKFLVDTGIVTGDTFMMAEADGEGPGTAEPHKLYEGEYGLEVDRRPLFLYYRRTFGFESLEQPIDMSHPILHHIPIGASVRTILQKLG